MKGSYIRARREGGGGKHWGVTSTYCKKILNCMNGRGTLRHRTHAGMCVYLSVANASVPPPFLPPVLPSSNLPSSLSPCLPLLSAVGMIIICALLAYVPMIMRVHGHDHKLGRYTQSTSTSFCIQGETEPQNVCCMQLCVVVEFRVCACTS